MKKNWSLWFIATWLIFVVSLSTWWLVFTLRKIEQLSQFIDTEEFLKEQNMIKMEGAVLVVSLLVGGIALIYYSLKERQHLLEMKLFFSTFTHDVKTTLARLILQGEKLFQNEDEAFKSFHKNLRDLERQLENSIYMAQLSGRPLSCEAVDLARIISKLKQSYSQLNVSLKGTSKINCDENAIESILKNLISNSVIHGQATEVYIKTEVLGGVTRLSHPQ